MRKSASPNYFYLVYKGNAINFIHGACVDEFINLVRAEMILGADDLISNNCSNGFNRSRESVYEKISKVYLRIFLKINDILFDKDRDEFLEEFLKSLNSRKIV